MTTIENESKARKIAIWIILLMTAIWIVLGFFSFTDSGDRIRPQTEKISFQGVSALRGKQVFMAYNCMDCHTIVGNGAYFAPDLTKIYEDSGPAYIKAFLGSPATYPTKTIVNIQLQDLVSKGEKLPTDIDAYLSQYPGAQKKVTSRGGVASLMPNLKFTAEEIDALIAYFKYTAKINTAGWPPKVIADPAVIEAEAKRLERLSGLPAALVPSTSTGGNATENASTSQSPVAAGEGLYKQLACAGCHSTDGATSVGPTFKGLYGSMVHLSNGKTMTADDAYIKEHILNPKSVHVQGYPIGVMPSFQGAVNDQDIANIIAYIKTLK